MIIKPLAFYYDLPDNLSLNRIPFGVLFSAVQNLNKSWPSLHIQHGVLSPILKMNVSNDLLLNSVNIIPTS